MIDQYLAAMMTAVFFLIVVVGRVCWQYKTVGDSGIRSGTLLKTKTEFAISLALVGHFPVQGLVVVIYAMALLQPQVNLGLIGNVVGVALCLSGTVLASYSQLSMKESWRVGVNPDEETQLVTTGIYSMIRNPIYTACIIYGIGIVVLAPHLVTLLSGLFGLISIVIYVKKIEEPYLLKKHGEGYRQYKAATGAYLPVF